MKLVTNGDGTEKSRAVVAPRPPVAGGRSEGEGSEDKVYSLLGLALEEEAFEADYTKTVQEVFVNVGRHLLGYPNPKIGHELALLASVKHYEDDQSDG